MKLEITKVEPIRKNSLLTLCGKTVESDVYPPNEAAKEFREYRRKILGLTLGQAARKLGLTVVQLSALEHGEYECDWELAVEILDYQGMIQ